MTKKATTVSVIGAAGRAGLGFSLVLANNGFNVIGLDKNEEMNKLINQGKMRYLELQGEEYLKKAISSNRFRMATDLNLVSLSRITVVIVGTPVDENLNPVIYPLINLIRQISKFIREGHLLIVRSTVTPGFSDRVIKLIERESQLKIGKGIFYVYAPERAVGGKIIRETQELPQIIGAYDEQSYKLAEIFFKKFVKSKILRVKPIEAEIGKLAMNAIRYVNFAFANFLYLICEEYDANVNLIIDAFNLDYPRQNLPTPGPNVGGPCLHKDGFLLTHEIPYADIINASWKINEGITMHIVKKIQRYPWLRKICLLGASYKADIDDTRNSLTFKIKKQLENNDYEVTIYDPNVERYNDESSLKDADCFILMTPHTQFQNFKNIRKKNNKNQLLIVDIWSFWKEFREKSINGFVLLC